MIIFEHVLFNKAAISGAVSTVGIVAGEAICGTQPTTTTKRPTTTTKRPTTTTSTAGQNDCFDYDTDIGGAILNGENQNHFQTAELCQAYFTSQPPLGVLPCFIIMLS